MKQLLVALILVFTISCSSLQSWMNWSQNQDSTLKLFEIPDKDYIDHLASLANDYKETEGKSLRALSNRSIKYLNEIHQKLVRNNELVLDPQIKPSFTVIKSSTPFIFSLPKGHYFFSSEVVIRYMQNEEIFVAALSHEIIRSHRNIYEKKAIIPTGYLQLEKLLSLVRLPNEIRQEVNKLSFYLVKRGGYDGGAILNWLQILNKNSLVFTTLLGDPRLISREEFSFKNFLVSETSGDLSLRGENANSNPDYYLFINEIRGFL